MLTATLGLDTGAWPAVPQIVTPCELPLRVKSLVGLEMQNPRSETWIRLLYHLNP